MNQTLLVVQMEQSEIKSVSIAIKYCYKKIIFDQENRLTYTKYLEQILEEQTPKEFLNTFKQLRAFSYGQSDWNWFDINESIVLSLSSNNSASFWSWLACHPNGYVREFALKKLGAESCSNTLPFLLITLNDHVENVRELAKQEISNSFIQENKETILFSFPLIKRLKSLEQKENLVIYDQLNNYLLDDFDLLQKAQESQDIYISRYGFELSFRIKEQYRTEVLKNGLKKTDRIILSWTFKEIQKEEHWEEQYLTQLLNHPQMIIRKLACEWCYNNRDKEERMISTLLDQTTSIKYLALDYVEKQFPEIDCREYYLQHLKENPINAIHGLAILQDKRDQERMLPLINSHKKKIRVSVFNWIGCLSFEEQLPVYIDCLSDPSRDVRNKAVDQLMNHYSLPIKEQLIPLFKEKKEARFQLSIIKILGEESRKDYFFDLVSLYVYAADQLVKDKIEQQLVGWMLSWNRRFFFRFCLKDKVELAYLVNKNYEEYSSGVLDVMWKVLRAK
ncbi:hypothetical protein JZO86_03900 [Enterococcus ureasiticus]|uniref:HEAT repeat domain-containing protein n=1 Tax=Enterococcus ureasiticus TaxID=903984 RepID=UPI001A8F5E1D|nr:hypothetical protein [Enterococcus ureasiticus]MBO0472848.1 hypothetical protein [Enterococcus ureasiticus]